MGHVLQLGVFLATALLGISLLLLGAGLAMVARPELFVGLGLANPGKMGLEVALAAGVAAPGSALVGRILDLVRGDVGDENGA